MPHAYHTHAAYQVHSLVFVCLVFVVVLNVPASGLGPLQGDSRVLLPEGYASASYGPHLRGPTPLGGAPEDDKQGRRALAGQHTRPVTRTRSRGGKAGKKPVHRTSGHAFRTSARMREQRKPSTSAGFLPRSASLRSHADGPLVNLLSTGRVLYPHLWQRGYPARLWRLPASLGQPPGLGSGVRPATGRRAGPETATYFLARWMREITAGTLRGCPPTGWNRASRACGRLIPAGAPLAHVYVCRRLGVVPLPGDDQALALGCSLAIAQQLQTHCGPSCRNRMTSL